jgi:hypothetical protein
MILIGPRAVFSLGAEIKNCDEAVLPENWYF